MSEFIFIAKKVVAQLAEPPTSLLVLGIVALITLKRWPRASRYVLGFSLITLLALSTPAVSRALNRAISVPRGSAQAQARAEAIVVLGGGQAQAADIGPVPTQASYERLRYGAWLAQKTHLPVLVTGGTVFSGPPEAQVMAGVLKEQFAVTPRWIEARSRNTHENAVYSAAILRAANVRTILLVTSDVHERRSLAEFRATGLEAIPMPATGVSSESLPLPERLPNARALRASAEAIHEMLGTLFATPRHST